MSTPDDTDTAFSIDIQVDGDHPRMQKFLNLVAQMKMVDWRKNQANMTHEMKTLCEMIEEGLNNEKILKGNAIMYAEGGKSLMSSFRVRRTHVLLLFTRARNDHYFREAKIHVFDLDD